MKPLTIAHLDTGISSAHPRLTERVSRFFVLDRDGQVMSGTEVYDLTGHGTHTAGIICEARYPGLPPLSPAARLRVVALPRGGKTLLNLLVGLDLLPADHLRVACLPVGIASPTPVFLGLIRALTDRDVLVVAAIGNRGPGRVCSPACYPQVLSVGAVDQQGRAAPFSGSRYHRNTHEPDILAPGVNIRAAAPGGGTAVRSGTSMACAYVAGVVARLRQARPDAEAATIRRALLAGAGPRRGDDRAGGPGLVRPAAALAALTAAPNGADKPVAAPPPAFQTQPYFDARLRTRCRRARPHDQVEAVIALQPGAIPSEEPGSAPPDRPPWLAEVARESGTTPGILRSFTHAELIHLRAPSRFFDALSRHPQFWFAGPVDVPLFNN
ncbi:MAG: S8 family serine peptidase [Acidobacteriota bacterium]|nr:S8 family serine peptidase [Acidobacteriota bacterium]